MHEKPYLPLRPGCLPTHLLQRLDRLERGGKVPRGHILHGAAGRLGQLGVGRVRREPRRYHLFDQGRLGGAEDGADVVGAPHVVEHELDGVHRQVLDGGKEIEGMLSHERRESGLGGTHIHTHVPTRMHTYPGLERVHGLVVIA